MHDNLRKQGRLKSTCTNGSLVFGGDPATQTTRNPGVMKQRLCPRPLLPQIYNNTTQHDANHTQSIIVIERIHWKTRKTKNAPADRAHQRKKQAPQLVDCMCNTAAPSSCSAQKLENFLLDNLAALLDEKARASLCELFRCDLNRQNKWIVQINRSIAQMDLQALIGNTYLVHRLQPKFQAESREKSEIHWKPCFLWNARDSSGICNRITRNLVCISWLSCVVRWGLGFSLFRLLVSC